MKNRIEIPTRMYTLPQLSYELLVVETDKSSSSSVAGMLKEIEIPNGGVTIHYRSSGGKEMQPSQFVTCKIEPPKPPEAPKIAVAPVMDLLPKPEPEAKKQLVEVAPQVTTGPTGLKINITDSASATVEPKSTVKE